MNQNKSIKKVIKTGGLEIKLFKEDGITEIPYESISNISAFNNKGELIWEVEAPKSHYDIYYNIYLDTSNPGALIAYTSNSFKHVINLIDGKVIDFYLVK